MARQTTEGAVDDARVIIITGGLSGIGHAIVEHFGAQGCDIVILDLPNPSSASIIRILKDRFQPATFTFHECNVTSWEDQARVFGRIAEDMGTIDMVFANAGVGEKGNFVDRVEVEDELRKPDLRTLDVNLMGTLYTVKLAIHYLRKNKEAHKGSITCTASNAGIYPFPVAPIYGTSKHAVVGLVRSLAKSLSSEGIQINALCPNVIATNLADNNLFSSMSLTPMSTLLSAVQEIATHREMTGATLEISGEKFTMRPPPDWVDEISMTNFERFWELGYA